MGTFSSSLCLAYNFIQYLRLYIPDRSFKAILDGLSAYLLWKKPPKTAVFIVGALKECVDIMDVRKLLLHFALDWSGHYGLLLY